MSDTPARPKDVQRRKRQIQPKKNYNTGQYTEAEKMAVLAGLHLYGLDVDKIATLVPTRSREQVKDFITGWNRKVNKGGPNCLTKDDTLELWLEKIRKMPLDQNSDNTNLTVQYISTAIGYIGKYEHHPSPTESGGVCFRDLYEFLEALLSGQATKSLSYQNSVFFLRSLKELNVRLQKMDFHLDEMYLKRPFAPKARTYKRTKKIVGNTRTQEDIEAEKLLTSRTFNPINFPIESLNVKKRLMTHTKF